MLENRLEIPPLNAERFNGSFNHFCSVKGLRVALDLEPPHVGEKEVDFHSLHQEVMNNRGYNANEVPDSSSPPPHKSKHGAEKGFSFQRRQDFWLKISQNLDLIHESPGMSPASAEVANRLATIYGQYLQQFDEIYVRSFVQELQHWGRHSTSIG